MHEWVREGKTYLDQVIEVLQFVRDNYVKGSKQDEEHFAAKHVIEIASILRKDRYFRRVYNSFTEWCCILFKCLSIEPPKRAAEEINRLRGWKRTEDRSEENRTRIKKDCLAALAGLKNFSWEKYTAALEAKGYTVKLKMDASVTVREYTIQSGNSASLLPRPMKGLSFSSRQFYRKFRLFLTEYQHIQLKNDSILGRFLIRQLARFCLDVWR